MQYALLNTVILAVAAAVVGLSYRALFTKRWLYVLGILLIMTIVFDSLIISSGIVAYNPGRYLGVLIGNVPAEDFAYTIAAAMVVPYVWNKLGGKKNV